jgi:hypothetical protein
MLCIARRAASTIRALALAMPAAALAITRDI